MSSISLQSIITSVNDWENSRKISGILIDLPRFEPGHLPNIKRFHRLDHWSLREETELDTELCSLLMIISAVFINNDSYKIPLNIWFSARAHMHTHTHTHTYIYSTTSDVASFVSGRKIKRILLSDVWLYHDSPWTEPAAALTRSRAAYYYLYLQSAFSNATTHRVPHFPLICLHYCHECGS